MNKHHLQKTLQAAVPNPPELFTRSMRDTLQGITLSEAQKESKPMKKLLTKRKVMLFAIVAVLLIASVAIAAVLLSSTVFNNTMGTTPENAASITQFNLASEIIGDVEVKVTEAAYDGMSLFINYTIRDMNATELMGVSDDPSGMRLLTMDDANHMAALDVGWWVDHIWIDGRSVDMPSMSGGLDVGTDTPGEVQYSTQYRLDQEDIYLSGEAVQISLPIGEKQSLDSLTIDRENDQTLMPDKGLVTFSLDCSIRDQIITLEPNIETIGPRWRAKVSQAVFTPIQTYITVDWSVDPDVMQAYIDENGEGFADEDGNIYWMYNGIDAVGTEVQSLTLVNENGVPVFETMEGFYGNQGVGPEQAWFTFPYAETLPDELYLAPHYNGQTDMEYAVRIR